MRINPDAYQFGESSNMTFTININSGPILNTFEASTFQEFISKLGGRCKIGSRKGLESFFNDRYQVKTLIDTNLLICRKR